MIPAVKILFYNKILNIILNQIKFSLYQLLTNSSLANSNVHVAAVRKLHFSAICQCGTDRTKDFWTKFWTVWSLLLLLPLSPWSASLGFNNICRRNGKNCKKHKRKKALEKYHFQNKLTIWLSVLSKVKNSNEQMFENIFIYFTFYVYSLKIRQLWSIQLVDSIDFL